MIVAIIGLIGTGKSTTAARIAQHRAFRLFDMDHEMPEAYRARVRAGEFVPANDVIAYQQSVVDRLQTLALTDHVVMAGFFLDSELPRQLEQATSVLWINLVPQSYETLHERLRHRTLHFSYAAAETILAQTWPERDNQIIGDTMIDCERDIDGIVDDCLSLVDSHNL
jgi:dephospho-CoA kinase